MKRQATVNRKTKEVKCSITLNLDGSGKFDVKTGIPFFNHMLEQFAKHGYLYTPNSINVAFFNSFLFEALCEKTAPTKSGLIGSITNLLNVLYLSDILLKYSLNERRQ